MDSKSAPPEYSQTVPHPARSTGKSARYRLNVASGVDAGRGIDIDGSQAARVLTGTSPICDLRLRDPKVSRRHAAFDVDRDILRVTDLESTNGTRVNGVRIFDAALSGGELVTIGDSVLSVERVAGTASLRLSPAVMFGRLVGASPEMKRIYPLCERLSASTTPLVIEGESGTGKELLAESLHTLGPRREGPFVVVDCADTPRDRLEMDLFGREGSEPVLGLFEQANGGTLVLDEVTSLAPELQAKVLRVLERGEVARLGSVRPLSLDVRVIATVRGDLDREVQTGRLRENLFLKLASARIEMPPLRRRTGDVWLLAEHFWKRLGADPPLPSDLVAHYEGYAWPGNVRELLHAVTRRVTLGDLAAAALAHDVAREMPTSQRGTGKTVDDTFERILRLNLPLPRARELATDTFVRMYLERVLTEHGGNVARASAASGIALRYFQLLRARYRR